MILLNESKRAIVEAVVNDFKGYTIAQIHSLALLHSFRRHYKFYTKEEVAKTSLAAYPWFLPLFNQLLAEAHQDAMIELLCEVQDQIHEKADLLENKIDSLSQKMDLVLTYLKQSSQSPKTTKPFRVAIVETDPQHKRQITDRLKGKGVEFEFCGFDKQDFDRYDGIVFKNAFATSSKIKIASRYVGKLIENEAGGMGGLVDAILKKRDEFR